jgi:hypothetical protein
MVFDLDYSPEGWVLIFGMSDGSKVTAVATEDWATIDTENLPAALSASTPLQVNFTEETSTWMVAHKHLDGSPCRRRTCNHNRSR